MTEKQMYTWLKKNVPDVLWQPIESSTGEGISDLNYLFNNGAEGWLELKGSASIAFRRNDDNIVSRRNFTLKVRPAQIAWILSRRQFRGRAFILCLLEKGLMGILLPSVIKNAVYEKGRMALSTGEVIQVPMDESGVYQLIEVLSARVR